MNIIKRTIAFLLVFILFTTPALAEGNALIASTSVPQSAAPIKNALPGVAKPDANKILGIAKKYYDLATAKATAEEKGIIAKTINWKPDFTGKTSNPARVEQYSYPSAFLAGYTDLKGLYLALNSAVFTLDVKNPTLAGNLASAIATYPEDMTKKPLGVAIKDAQLKSANLKKAKPKNVVLIDVRPYADDAAAVYEYALSLELAGGTVDLSAMPLLLNYGYLCIDKGSLNTAKLLFETAMKLAPGYLPAHEGMAAYWLAVGDKKKAQKVLEGATKPLVYRKMTKMGEDTAEKKAPQVSANNDLSTMEKKLKTLGTVPTVLATDFYEDLDPDGVAKVRQFVDNLAAEWKYTAPNFNYMSQFSTLPAFSSGSGKAAYEAFLGEYKVYTKKYGVHEITNTKNVVKNTLGVDLDFGVDINKLMADPKKYKDLVNAKKTTIRNDVKNAVKKLVPQLKTQAKKAKLDLKKGNTKPSVDLAASISPEFAIYKMKPGNYANPTDVMTQQYNMTVLLRKLNGYNNYFFKQNADLQRVITEDSNKFTWKMGSLHKGRNKALEKLEEEYKVGKISDDAYIIKKHAIHEEYDPQMNNLCETTWMDATNFVNSRYVQHIKPNIEAMYADCMRNCMLISDPKIRKLKEDEINAGVHRAVFNTLGHVSNAYALGVSGYPYSCDCSEEEVAAAKERERKVFEEAEYQKTIMENKARKDFEQGDVKESSQLYKRLDKYSASYSLLFMHAKWHPLKTEVNYDVKIPGIDTGINAKMIKNHIRETTTYSGGLTAKVAGGEKLEGALSAEAAVSLQGEVTVDGKGNVVRMDVVGTAQGSVTTGVIQSTATYEASVMRGCKLSGEVAKVYNDNILKTPGDSSGGDQLKYSEDISIFQGEKPKKVLWQGEYQLTK